MESEGGSGKIDSVSASLPAGRSDLFYQEVAEGGVLFDAEGEKVYVLNASSAFVWNCLDGRRSAREIAAELGEALGPQAPGPDVLLRDVDRVLEDFQRQKLLATP